MKRCLFACLLAIFFTASMVAQSNAQPWPKEARSAKTVAIVNNTHNDAVAQGAAEAIQRWGQLSVVEGAEAADLVLTFDKKSEHQSNSTEKTGADGKTESGFGMTFGSSVSMKAKLKGAEVSFYTTRTGESKKKAGSACVTDLQGAYNVTH